MATGQTAFGLIGVGGGIVGTLGERGSGSPRGGPPSHQMAAGQRARSASPRGGRRHASDAFSQPRDALSLAKTPASDRPVGLLGSVLRREAAIAAMKTAVQVAPPPPGRDRTKALRELAETIHELREATVDAVELLGARPKDQARFYWNGMDLVLKMLTDLQWAPFPQIVDPLLWKWFGYWSEVWAIKREATNPEPFAVRGGAQVLQRCRLAEKSLLKMAGGAAREGAGTGGWATLKTSDACTTLLRVQEHRLTAAHSEGGANHAQRRRFNNTELLLYGRQDVHLGQLRALAANANNTETRAALLVQQTWRIRKGMMKLAMRADVQLNTNTTTSVTAPRRRSAATGLAVNNMLTLGGGAVGASASPVEECAAQIAADQEVAAAPQKSWERTHQSPLRKSSTDADSETLDRSFLNSMSLGLPEMS